ncbi:uncharacterized protein I303_104415 [Kwoniella dejecticola CBS 10117]|uniref:Uncharacterized protein n=1 Tax=Kwoniella dejecticola CBS 10117 TaxID=1296121 RepID=A0A1A6A5D8_9TREE|nr:uncharacterized protein I303_04606 [Kwoniella dejecticola CBS 10117]OBR85273.1 hypothetical protein I303_04606 [Kwoniella dejecticola CBS 10117]
MNTAGSVAYGWGALIVAAGVSFYYAKKEIDARRKDATLRGNRPLEKLSWEEKIAQQASLGDKNLKPIQDSIPKEAFKPPEAK